MAVGTKLIRSEINKKYIKSKKMSLFTAMFIMAPRRQQEQILEAYASIVMLAFILFIILYLNGTLIIENGDKVEV